MKKDLTTQKDIEQLVDLFYTKVKVDQVIGRFFTEVMQVDWEKHIPTMYDFWSNVLFYSGNYTGNPMQQHIAIHSKAPFTVTDFTQWNLIFTSSVDELFAGENAETLKQRAQNISTIMQVKLFQKK
ncbi:MAG: group III truncated hemoglobin [bacterium]|nr:group III truncated hemoglobin [bacterium]